MIDDERALGSGVLLRGARVADAASLAAAYLRNREHLRPWEPRRNERFFTREGQEARLLYQRDQRHAGRMMPWLLVADSGVVGVVALTAIAMGPFRSGNLNYWLDTAYNRRGVATAAVDVVCGLADTEVGLHRVQASTMLDNTASQQVLVKCGFAQIGVARDYLHIDGGWRDQCLYQRILNDRPAISEPSAGGRATRPAG